MMHVNNVRDLLYRVGSHAHRGVSLMAFAACVAMAAGPRSMAAQQAKDTTYKRYVLRAAVDGGASIHNASFTQLPGYATCCTTFDGGTGLAIGLSGGIDFDTDVTLFDVPIRYGIDLAIASMGATLRSREFVGNIIRGNERFDGVVEHSIAATYLPIAVEPFVLASIPSVPALSLRAGVSAGIPVVASFAQQQVLAEPASSDYTFETGSRVRGEQSGSIPGAG